MKIKIHGNDRMFSKLHVWSLITRDVKEIFNKELLKSEDFSANDLHWKMPYRICRNFSESKL